ncbi:MAG: phenylalanine--tRNA ligase subunit beta [Desulfurococcaceae archaeon]
MPVIRVNIHDLEGLSGKKLSDKEIYKYLAKLKCEVELIHGDILEYEANSDRPDLFSVEGLARALKPWLGIEWRDLDIRDSDIRGYAERINERPYVALAVVRDVVLSDEAISQIMQLQEKLAMTYGRGRRKASIGVYDLDKINPPIYYKSVDPNTVVFKPLGEQDEMTLREALFKTEKGRMYGYIIQEMPRYPVLMDSQRRVLSLVPVINSDHCKVTTETRNILIDSTGLSIDMVVNMVTIMAFNIAERSRSRIIEVVKVYHDNELVEAPRKERNKIHVNIRDINEIIGLDLSIRDVIELLSKHYYVVNVVNQDELIAEPPVYRLDVRTWIDVAEDVAIAYGYEKLGKEADSLPASSSIGRIHPLEYISKRIREIMIGLEFTEIANYMMSNRAIQVDLFNTEYELFEVENPRSEKYTGLRVWLTPGLIEVISENQEKSPKLTIFEVGDVVVPDMSMETGARIDRRLGFAITHEKATLTDGIAYVRAILKELGLEVSFTEMLLNGFLPERTVSVNVHGESLGFVGEVHPTILYKIGIKNPVVIAEISLGKLLKIISHNILF